jgi:DNA-binding PadR family transcriptional regulator
MTTGDRDEPPLSTEEGAVLALVVQYPRENAIELTRRLNERHQGYLHLEVEELKAVLDRLEAKGLVSSKIREW